MTEPQESHSSARSQLYTYKAETRQLLNILIHSLYSEREIFLRELLSNASDALTRMGFEMLTNREVVDPDVELAIWIQVDKEARTLSISDTGVGMTSEEMVANLGTIAHSGARAFVDAYQKDTQHLSDIIGQFGVGFYSAFMAADWIRVNSRSYMPQAAPAAWYSDGSDAYTIETGEKETRGTQILIQLKEDALEYLEEHRIREIIRKHSDFVAFPIYIGENKEQANQQTALWRQLPRQVEAQAYDAFYKQLTLDFEPPLTHAHMVVDAPVQMYAILFVPSNAERSFFSARKEEGFKLYSRKVLIQEYCKDLLPEYLGFVQGVVDSEDLPLNISRETVQANRIMANLKKLVTGKVLDMLKQMGKEDPEKYLQFWTNFSRFIKQGIALEPDDPETLFPLLRFKTNLEAGHWSSLDEYIGRLKPEQNDIYYILGDDERSVMYSPHLDLVKKHGYEVLLLTDPLDSFMLVRLTGYQNHTLTNIASADLALPSTDTSADQPEKAQDDEQVARNVRLVVWFKTVLAERVSDVRLNQLLRDSPARLVDSPGAPKQELQRVYRLLNKQQELPIMLLELNPNHPLMQKLAPLPELDALATAVIEQVFENALLIEGLHPDPASMISRIQKLMESALN